MADVITDANEGSPQPPQSGDQRTISSQEQDSQHALEEEEAERSDFQRRIPDYLQLHESVNSSNLLLDSLASFLATFQRDLSDVSGQIFELQNLSQDIEERSKGRKSIAKPLNALISDIILSPTLITTIRDTRPGDAWLPLIVDLEQKINAVKTNGKVKAAHETGMVVEGLKAKARSPEYAEPIGTPSSAELAAQTLLLSRGLGGATRSSTNNDSGVDQNISNPSVTTRSRLRYAKVDDQDLDVVAGYEADNKEYKQPVVALFRSLLLVLLDNASAEFTFLVRFFSPAPETIAGTASSRNLSEMTSPSSSDPAVNTLGSPMRRSDRKDSNISLFPTVHSAEGSPISAPSPLRPADSISDAGDSVIDRALVASPISRPGTTRARPSIISQRNGSVVGGIRTHRLVDIPRDTRKELEALWHQVFDPALEYCEAFFKSVAEPVAPPSTISLLTMLRLNDGVLSELEARGCTPLESVVLGLKLGMWPLFQKQMDSHIDSVKRMADAASGGGFGAMLGRAAPKDSAIHEVAARYACLVSSIAALSEENEEAMLVNR
ncbi:hypothetical protein QFC19_005013 [Naganishia cerealis]|uniref:Uncharacterized protein n=1 Tax=Naganishia cerealis TaxID=610337 RepID=A0ACC2VRG6_9TREE|nr:hypothetical protein QFC19_005013 [Naganishia cerealis]